jgi:uridine kinase
MVIAIGGVSRAGKTSLAKKIAHLINKENLIIKLDDFTSIYNNKYRINDLADWENPDCVDFTKLYEKIIIEQRNVPVLIIEGFLITHDLRIRNLINYYIHIELSYETFVKRRAADYREPAWYIEHVWESHQKNGLNFRDLTSHIINGENEIDLLSILRFLNLNSNEA